MLSAAARAPTPDEPSALKRAVPSPARIAVVLPALGAGGSERVISLLANHWAEQGRSITLVTFEPPGTPPYYPIDPRVTLRQLGLPPRPEVWHQGLRRTVARARALRRALRAADPELVLSFLTRTNILALLAARGLDRPVIVSERNNPERQRFGPVWTWLRARTYPHADCLVTMTERALAALPPAERPRSRVIPNPVMLPEGWRPRRDGRTIAAVGRLVGQKGFDLLLRAFAQVAPAHPDWRLVIWGEGEERAALERQRVELGLEGRVELPGITARPGEWVETADLFVLSSRFEGWGIVVAEAMAAGLPVVSFDCPFGPREMIRDGVDGLLVPDQDVAALAAALDRALGDPSLRARLAAAARVSAERFAPARVMAGWDSVVADVVAARRS